MLRNKSYLTRRDFLASAATIVAGSRVRAAMPSCTLVREQEEGPYYLDFGKLRWDLREGKPGMPLRLQIALLDARTCMPIENAAVDIWHCDAMGVYSGFTASGGGQDGPRGFGPPPNGGPPRGGPGGQRGPGPGGRGGRGAVDDTRFLRGVQLTNAQGVAEFLTLYPGWYAGRTIHIHLKAHIGGHADDSQYSGGQISHTGQIFLPEDATEQVSKLEPYVKHDAVHRTLHSEDHIFMQQGGAQSIASLERRQNGSNASGFLATIALALNPDAVPRTF